MLITSGGRHPADTESTIQQYVEDGNIVSSFVNANPSYGIAYAYGGDAGIENGNLQSGQLVIEPALLGDADLNGSVNFHDLQILLTNYGQAGFWDQGNFDGDPTVDFNDIQELLDNYGNSTTLSYSELGGIENLVGQYGFIATPNPDGDGFALVAVPEPASAALAGAGSLVLLRRRKRTVRPPAKHEGSPLDIFLLADETRQS